MSSQSCRIFPWTAQDGDYQPLLAFAWNALETLCPGLAPPRAERSREEERQPCQFVLTTLRFGDERAGFLVTNRTEEVEFGASTLDANTMAVTAYGLQHGLDISLESVRGPNHRDHLRTLALRVAGLEQARAVVCKAFAQEFGGRAVTEEQVRSLLWVARWYLRPHMWEQAAQYAEVVLRARAEEPEALFVSGAARAAQSRFAEALQALSRAAAARPENHDAWYNLGLVELELGDAAAAVRSLRRALARSPANHAILHQLGVALEACGEGEAALEAYRGAVASTPNPRGAWGYRGMDFTQAARDALARIEKSGSPGASGPCSPGGAGRR